MKKVLSFKLQQCFNPFVMLSVQGSSETLLFRHLSNDVFRKPKFRKYISYEGYPFLKISLKINEDLKNAKKN